MKHETFKYSSPLGAICCTFEGPFLIDVSLGGEEAGKQARGSVSSALSPAARTFFEELDAYFKGTLKEFRQEVAFTQGTAFERSVWLALRDIPYGESRSYKWIAGHVGRPQAARAAGRALGRNPLPLILPCHRVIASDGSLCGFSGGGIEVKQWLLTHERQVHG